MRLPVGRGRHSAAPCTRKGACDAGRDANARLRRDTHHPGDRPHPHRRLTLSVIYAIDSSERIVYLTTVGEPAFDEWRDALLGVFSHPSFKPGFNFISDRRQASAPSPDFIEQQIGFLREHERDLGRCRWAAVVPDPATDRVARVVTERAQVTDVEVGFFYSLAEARRWVFRP